MQNEGNIEVECPQCKSKDLCGVRVELRKNAVEKADYCFTCEVIVAEASAWWEDKDVEEYVLLN